MTAGRTLLLSAAILAIASRAAGQVILVAHLPNAPVESATRVSTALDAVARWLSEGVPGLSVELQLFRRWEDAATFVDGPGRQRLGLLLCDAAFLVDLDLDLGVEPAFRLERSGAAAQRRLLVARSGAGFDGIAALRGKVLGVAETSGPIFLQHLRRAVFEGALIPEDHFAEIRRLPDDFSVVAAVLHGEVDAAVVAEDNPLLAANLGGELIQLFASRPLSLEILALRPAAFSAEQLSGLRALLDGASTDDRVQTLFADLGRQGLAALPGGTSPLTLADLGVDAGHGPELEIMLPPRQEIAVHRPSVPARQDLTLVLGIDLPDVPISAEAADAPPQR